ncbi:hypothetical protein [Rathayibacter sp. VKM Ac-2858]|nr:hypothetical protein [Rathayibacter sp. VKM Ac-2858]
MTDRVPSGPFEMLGAADVPVCEDEVCAVPGDPVDADQALSEQAPRR